MLPCLTSIPRSTLCYLSHFVQQYIDDVFDTYLGDVNPEKIVRGMREDSNSPIANKVVENNRLEVEAFPKIDCPVC